MLKENAIAIIPRLHENFSAQRFSMQHFDQVMAVFTQAFCDSEPMTKYINMQYSEFHPFAEAVARKAIIDELSSVIIEKKSGRVVALSLAEDLTDPVALDMASLTKKFGPIFSLLEQLSQAYFAKHPPLPNQIAHLFITAVSDHFRNLGLSIHANFYAMQLAREKNFLLMLSELTNHLNEKGIVPHLRGYKECIGEIIYRDFEFENHKPFEDLAGRAHAYLWQLPADIQFI